MDTYESLVEPGNYITTDGVIDEKFKTIFVKNAQGKEFPMSTATLEKYWKRVDNPNTGLS